MNMEIANNDGAQSVASLPPRTCWANEYELQCWVCDWLSAQGWEVWIEVASLGVSHDVVGTKNGKMLVVEAKLNDWKRVLKQAKNGDNIADYLAIAMPRASEKCRAAASELGISVITPEMKSLPELKQHTNFWKAHRETTLKRLESWPRGYDWPNDQSEP